MFRGKGRNWALNIGTGIGIIEESACERSKVEKERKRMEVEREEEGGRWREVEACRRRRRNTVVVLPR